MAWYAIYRWCKSWRKAPLFNFIEWYSWEIKTPEEREQILLKEEQERKEARRQLAEMFSFSAVLAASLPDDGYFKQCLNRETKHMLDILGE